jgi:hypothetical protein
LIYIGIYDPIPKTYSKELSQIIAWILQINPANRPNCDQLLNNQSVMKRMDFAKGIGKAKVNLIGTIRMPQKLSEITKNLPKGHYQE